MISADLTDKNAIIIFPFQSTGTQMIVVGLKTWALPALLRLAEAGPRLVGSGAGPPWCCEIAGL